MKNWASLQNILKMQDQAYKEMSKLRRFGFAWQKTKPTNQPINQPTNQKANKQLNKQAGRRGRRGSP